MRRRAAATVGLALALCALTPASASAFNPLDAFCTLAGWTIASKSETGICRVAAHPAKLIGIGKKVIGVGKKLASGHLGSALHLVAGGASKAVPALGLGALVTWVLGGAAFALHETATLLGKTTNPELGAAWFSATYLHMAAIAALLTLPFLFAAAVQALMRSDLAMLARAALGYLPLAMLAIAVAAPLTMLLLAASDSLSNIIEQASGHESTSFLLKASLILGSLTVLAHSPFVAFLIGFFVAAGALVLWLELVLREVAVYVIVLTLPLAFAALVWPARRIWALRAVEVLMALILAKLAIVSVLALGAGALDHASASASIVSLLAGIALVTLGSLAPWALVKLMPLGDLAAAAAAPLRGQLRAAAHTGESIATPWEDARREWARDVVAGMHRHAMAADPSPQSGAGAEAARLAALGSGETGSGMDGVEGVTGGEDPDPLRGTAGPPGGQRAEAPPGGPDAPAARGPAPQFQGFEGAEAYWRKEKDWPTLVLGPDGCAPPPTDGDPSPPTPPPADGHPTAPTPPLADGHLTPPAPPPADDHPLPPRPEPGDGRL